MCIQLCICCVQAKRFDENICAQIFSHLAREDKLRCMAVCKTWAAYGYSLTAEILHADLTSKNLIVWRLNEVLHYCLHSELCYPNALCCIVNIRTIDSPLVCLLKMLVS